MYKLRDYQQASVDAVIDWFKKSVEPCLVEAATGAGKSLIVAAISKWFDDNAQKKVLCLAPSKELTEQNAEKYAATGEPFSFFSASLGKSIRHNVVFGMPRTVLNSIRAFSGGEFGCVVIDEAHGITPTLKKIIEKMRLANPQLRVVGLSATPYRLNDGYIFGYWSDGRPVDQDQTKNPFFHTLVYRITAPELIARGYLTQPHADPDHAESYDTKSIKRHSQKEYERAFEGKGRKTAQIIADVVSHSQNKMGVMIFAATKQHALECMESLPENSRMIMGDTPKAERAQIISAFKARQFKYLVNVAVLTTGFDAPHVDVVAILRATESASLLQQIIGRGMRIHDEKNDCLVLDYAENIERHQLENDLFTPIIKARHNKKGEPIDVQCPSCHTVNSFSMRPNPDDFAIDGEGYFIDLMGERIKTGDDEKETPAHFGRRCFGYVLNSGISNRCEYRWSVKHCPECEHENDIAARFCESCKAEIIDPNEKLKLDFHRMKADPYSMSTDRVLSLVCVPWMSNAGNETIKATFITEYKKFTVWFMPKAGYQKGVAEYEAFSKAMYGGRVAPDVKTFMEHIGKSTTPKTVTYQKTNKYFNIYGYNHEPDKIPD